MHKTWSHKGYIILSLLIGFLFLHEVSYSSQFASDSCDNNSSLNTGLIESQLIIEIPIWVPGFRGSFSHGDITIDGEGQSGDYLSKLFDSDLGLDFYFVGKLGFTLNKWNIQTDVFGGQLKYAVNFKYNNTNLIDVELFTIMPRLYISYNLFDLELRKMQNSDLKVWIYGGVRYYHVNIKSEFIIDVPKFEIDKNWTDPIIGYTIPFQVSKWTIMLQNDFGGFGIGSNFSWWLQLNCRYKIGKRTSLVAGWVMHDIYYKDGKLPDPFTYNVRLNGPVVGITVQF